MIDKTELEEQFKKFLIYGSLLFAQNERGEKVWLKRIIGDEEYKVTPVSVLNGQIILKDETN